MGAQMVREVASRTSDLAGDGTTTATVLAQASVREGSKAVAAGMNPMDLNRGIELGRAATETTIRHSINERIGREVCAKWVKSRLAEAQAAGLATCRDDAGSVRLTALGVERLSGIGHPRGRE